jgi:hypothetical protein
LARCCLLLMVMYRFSWPLDFPVPDSVASVLNIVGRAFESLYIVSETHTSCQNVRHFPGYNSAMFASRLVFVCASFSRSKACFQCPQLLVGGGICRQLRQSQSSLSTGAAASNADQYLLRSPSESSLKVRKSATSVLRRSAASYFELSNARLAASVGNR